MDSWLFHNGSEYWQNINWTTGLFGITYEGKFVAPTIVEGWKVQGVTESPAPWRLIVDIPDFNRHQWIIAYALCSAAAAI